MYEGHLSPVANETFNADFKSSCASVIFIDTFELPTFPNRGLLGNILRASNYIGFVKEFLLTLTTQQI